MKEEGPKLVNRRENRKSSFRMGRTIGEKREKLETANERVAARKKDKKKKNFRIVVTMAGFLMLGAVLVMLCLSFVNKGELAVNEFDISSKTYDPTIEIVDEDAPNSEISSRMKAYIGQAEKDFRDLGYSPVKAVIPTGGVREIDFYLQDHSGFIKMIIGRDTAVSVEDADRMMKYLEEIGVGEYSYIDVRIEGKAYWK